MTTKILTAEQQADPIVAGWDERLKTKIHFESVERLQLGPDAGLCSVHKERFWVVHPAFGAIFFQLRRTRSLASLGSPQCNASEVITERIRDDLYPGADIMLIDRAFVPIDLNDYR